jgi:hypothetical protein
MGLATAFALAIAVMLPAGPASSGTSLSSQFPDEEQERHDEVMQRVDELDEQQQEDQEANDLALSHIYDIQRDIETHERLRDERLWAVTVFVLTILIVGVGIKVVGVCVGSPMRLSCGVAARHRMPLPALNGPASLQIKPRV